MRSAFHPERVLHPVQLRPDEYDGLYRVWTEQVHHESCGEGKPVSDVHSSLRHGRNPMFAGRTGIFVYNGKLLGFLRSLGSGLRVYGNVVADPMHCLQTVASRQLYHFSFLVKRSARILLVGDLLLQFHRDHSLQHALPGCPRESELPLLCAKHCKPVQCICLLFSLSLETA